MDSASGQAAVAVGSVKHYPNAELGKRWAVLNDNNETVAYAYCYELAADILRLLRADSNAAAQWLANPYA